MWITLCHYHQVGFVGQVASPSPHASTLALQPDATHRYLPLSKSKMGCRDSQSPAAANPSRHRSTLCSGVRRAAAGRGIL